MTIVINKIQNITPIHIGDVTHHHDHVITPINLRIKNTMNTTVPIPTPDDVLFDIV